MEDYTHLLSKPMFYIEHKNWNYPMQTLEYDPMFDSVVETPIAVAWISLPSLPPNVFGREVVFSLAAAVGKSLQVHMATTNKIKPSYAKAKVEVDLLPMRINIEIKKKSGEILSKWMQIKYNSFSKYCRTCKLQEHNEDACFVLLPKLFDGGKKDNKLKDDKQNKDMDKNKKKEGEHNHKKEMDMQKLERGNDGIKGKGLHKEGIITRWDPKSKVDHMNTSNHFQVLEEQKEQAPTTDNDKESKQEENQRQ